MPAGIRFDDQVAVVTGGGRNLGRAYALEFARRGAAVVVNDLPGEGAGRSVADDVVAEIRAAGGRAEPAHGFVDTPEGARGAIDVALERFGCVDVVVNNAGIMRNGYLEQLTVEQFDAVVSVNLRGAFLVSQAAWPAMRANGYGRLIMVSSAGGMFSFAAVSNYAAAKAGVYGLCKAFAYEGAPHGIKVNAILPMGGTMASMDTAPQDHERNTPPGLRDALAPRRLPECVAELVVYLASRDCPVSGEAYSSAFGRYARVFAGLTEGWAAEDPASVTAEDVARHFDEIRDTTTYTIPRNQYDELEAIAATLGVGR